MSRTSFNRPPALAERLLAKTLRSNHADTSLLGDLAEDYTREQARRGSRSAGWFYWREALALTLSIHFSRLALAAGRAVNSRPRILNMIEALAPQGLRQDAIYAVRAIRGDLPLLAFATLIIGLGVGATTAVFSVMKPLLIEPLPLEEPERLAWIALDGEGGGLSSVTSRTSNLRDFRELSSSFESITGYNAFFTQDSYNLTGAGEPERLSAVGVSHDFLDVLGIQPAMGRTFTAEEEQRWDDSVIILSHAFWKQRFAGDADILGRVLTINGGPSEVIGVLPSSFDFSATFSPNVRIDFLTLFPIDERTDRWGNTISMIGRLAEAATVESAQKELDSIVARLQEADPQRWGLGAKVTGLHSQISNSHRSALLLLFGASAVVMLIVCVNLCSLLLSKGIHRKREMFLRSALGAPRGRLLRQMLLESLLLALGGAALGVAIALAATQRISASTAIDIPLLRNVEVDGLALLFTAGCALAAGLAVGVLPALQASGLASPKAMGAARSMSQDRNSTWLREGLVVAEVAMACMLLIVGGLLLQSFQRVQSLDLGFSSESAAAWQIYTDRDFDSLEARSGYYREIAEQIRVLPGVESVALTDAIPLGENRQWGVNVPDRQTEADEFTSVYPHLVSHDYFDTMQIPLLDGRGLSMDDSEERETVVVLNESAHRELFEGGSGLGREISLGSWQARVVGVVGDIRHVALEQASGSQMYFHFAQVGDFDTLDMVVRSSLPLEQLRTPVHSAIRELDVNMPTNDVRTLEAVVDNAASPRRFTLTLLSAFALTAVVLAAMGIYGVLSYTVSERRREIAIRMALGESTQQVRRRVLLRTLALCGLGVGAGIIGALASSGLLESLLFEVEAVNPVTFAVMAAAVLSIAAAAALLPAIRASRTDALTTLRSSG